MGSDEAPGRILIVDDESANLEILASLLEKEGFTVSQTTSGQLALKAVARSAPDLVLLDIRMPGMDGFEVCERMRIQEPGRDIPVIFVSSLTDTADKVRGFDLGAIDYIPKPIEPAEALARVRTHIAVLRLRRQLMEANVRLGERVADRTAELERTNEALSRKNIALRELMDGIQESQRRIGDNVASNIEKSVLPRLRALEQGLSTRQQSILREIEHDLQDIVSPFLNALSRRFASLTPTEIRVCHLIRRGLGSKEIADIEGRSHETIRAHRRSIRRKLNLIDSKANLASYLESVPNVPPKSPPPETE